MAGIIEVIFMKGQLVCGMLILMKYRSKHVSLGNKCSFETVSNVYNIINTERGHFRLHGFFLLEKLKQTIKTFEFL